MQASDVRPVQPHGNGRKKRGTGFFRSLFRLVLLIGVFWLGLNIGNGTIGIKLYQPVGKNEDLPSDMDYSEVERVYDNLRANYDGELKIDELLDGLKKGLVSATGDPYSEYLNAEEAKEFSDQLAGTFSGIGAELGKDEDGNLIIVAPINGFPADKAGLRPKDIVLSVDGTNTTGMSINEAVLKIRGKPGTKVKLEIFRGNSERKEFEITRENITIPSVKWEELPGKIGYIEITQFWTDTAALTEKAAKELKNNGVKSIILDLRGNPGGSLDASINIADMWLEKDKIIVEERRDGESEKVYRATGDGILKGMKTIVLIDEGSASASEIVAGALRDNNAATLLGVTSYGKGSVQKILPLQDGSEVKVTVARWHRPNGKNIDKVGIKPDQKVQFPEEFYGTQKDPQRDAAIKALKQ